MKTKNTMWWDAYLASLNGLVSRGTLLVPLEASRTASSLADEAIHQYEWRFPPGKELPPQLT
jgi:hypothetical protein